VATDSGLLLIPGSTNLLVLGPTYVRGVGVHTGAGHVAQLAPQLGLHPPGPVGGPRLAPGLEGRLLLLVLLALQVLLVCLGER